MGFFDEGRDRRQARRQRRRNPNPLPGDAPLTPEQTQAREGIDARAGLESQRFAGDRGGLTDALAGFQGLASGEGPSLAQDQFKAGQERNIAATIAAMGSARGGNLNAAQTGAAQAGAGLAQAGNLDLAQLRSQEQLSAMQGQAGIAGQLAGLSSGRELGLLGLGQDALQGQAGLQQQRELANAQLAEEMRRRRSQTALEAAQLGAQVGGDVLGGVLSDERMKEDITPVQPGGLASKLAAFAEVGASEALGELTPSEFSYTADGRRRGGVAGRLAGVMAQDLQRSPKGRDAVKTGPGGELRVDVPRGLSLALAAGADHEKRLRAVEAA